ncbi:MAG: YihY/virulence factor BrkB family protein [Ginsengibacter sp.]
MTFLKKISSWRLVLKKLFKEFSTDYTLKYSAALAYYTVFSIAPLLVILTALFGFMFGKEAMQGQIYSQLKNLIGSKSAIQIQDVIKNIHLNQNNLFATIVSIVILVIGATSIFNEIQDSINKIWGLRIKSSKVWWQMLFRRLLSFILILVVGAIMIFSLLLNTLIGAFGTFISRYIENYSVYVIQWTEAIFSLVILSFLFSILFKVLPDAKIPWKIVLIGGLITAVLFSIGKLGISFYISKSNLTSLYGAAGSFIIFMTWVYYSSIILYLGAEFTKVFAKLYGKEIIPNDYAEWVIIEKKTLPSVPSNNKDLG